MATKSAHDRPILVTGAAGDVGAIGRNFTAMPLVVSAAERLVRATTAGAAG